MCIAGRLPLREQRLNLTEQIVTDAHHQALSGLFPVCRGFRGIRMGQEPDLFLGKRDHVSIDRDSVSVIREKRRCAFAASRRDNSFFVERAFRARVMQGELCASIVTIISGAKHNLVSSTLPIPLPRSLKELEELVDNNTI